MVCATRFCGPAAPVPAVISKDTTSLLVHCSSLQSKCARDDAVRSVQTLVGRVLLSRQALVHVARPCHAQLIVAWRAWPRSLRQGSSRVKVDMSQEITVECLWLGPRSWMWLLQRAGCCMLERPRLARCAACRVLHPVFATPLLPSCYVSAGAVHHTCTSSDWSVNSGAGFVSGDRQYTKICKLCTHATPNTASSVCISELRQLLACRCGSSRAGWAATSPRR